MNTSLNTPRQPTPCPEVRLDESGWAVVTLFGEQDCATAAQTTQALKDAEALATGRVIADLTEVTFAGAALLASLAYALRRARRQPGGAVKVVSTDSRLAAKMRVTGLDRILPIYATLDDALQSVATSPEARY
jgi:anti-sigma B factor antagonist